jgi:hypothetical protein
MDVFREPYRLIRGSDTGRSVDRCVGGNAGTYCGPCWGANRDAKKLSKCGRHFPVSQAREVMSLIEPSFRSLDLILPCEPVSAQNSGAIGA